MSTSFPDHESLLQHRDFLRALARQLLHDEHAADDVVQESMMAVIANPPKTAEALRAWLAKVVVRRAANHKRGEARRSRRERESAKAEEVPAADQVHEGLSAQRRVLAVLDELPEPYKTTIYMRWYLDLPPREIARRMDVGVETVRSRAQRGLARMRKELDGEFGSRESWAAILAPMTWARVSFVAPWLAVAAMVALTLFAGVLLWELRPRDISPNALRPALTMLEAREKRSLELGTRAGREFPQRTNGGASMQELASAGQAAFADTYPGEITELDSKRLGPRFEFELGLPPAVQVADLVADLYLLGDSSGASATQRAHVIGTEDLRQGRRPWVAFDPMPRLSLTRVSRRTSSWLRVRTRDGRWGAETRVHAIAGDYPLPIVLELAPRASLSIEVRDEFAVPIPMAKVTLELPKGEGLDIEVTTDAGGEVHLPSMGAGLWRWSVRSALHEAREGELELSAEASTRHSVVLSALPEMEVAGRWWSRSAQVVEEGPLRLRSCEDPDVTFFAEARRAASQAGEGTFDFGSVPVGEYWLLPPLESSYAWDPPARRVNTAERDLLLQRLDGEATRPVRVRAFDRESGQPIEQFETIFLIDRYGKGMRRAAEIELGIHGRNTSFDSSPWPPLAPDLPVRWLVECEGYKAQQGERRDLRREGDHWVLDVNLDPAWRATFWMGYRDGEGRPLPLERAKLMTVGGRELGRTLADGFLHLELNHDPGRLRAESKGMTLKQWKGFRRGLPIADLDLYELWFVPTKD